MVIAASLRRRTYCASGARLRWKRSSRAIKSPRCRGAELVASASSLGSVALEPCSHAGGGFRSSGERGLRSSAHPTVHRLAQEGVSANSAAHLDIRRTFGWRSPFCWLCAQEGRFELQAFVSCYTSPDSEHRPGEQRAPERFEAEPNTGEQFPPARMLLFGPEQCPKLVPNSAKASSSGTEGSNLSRSATESRSPGSLRPSRLNSAPKAQRACLFSVRDEEQGRQSSWESSAAASLKPASAKPSVMLATTGTRPALASSRRLCAARRRARLVAARNSHARAC